MSSVDPLLYQAMQQVRDLLTEAKARNLKEAIHASLATASASGQPSVRTIYLTAVQDDGIVFFINRQSGKGKQLQENPQAGLCLFWPELQEQVTLQGKVEMLSAAECDRYWRQRPRDAQIASWASDQAGEPMQQEALKGSRDEVRSKHAFDDVPRPEAWQAVLLQPNRMEFWRTGWQHLRARHLYWLNESGQWQESLDNP